MLHELKKIEVRLMLWMWLMIWSDDKRSWKEGKKVSLFVAMKKQTKLNLSEFDYYNISFF